MGSLSAAALLREARQLGVDVRANGDRLVVDAPQGVMTPGLLDALRRHKAELLVLVPERPPAPGPTAPDPTGGLLDDPLIRRALNWAAREAPRLADGVIAALARLDRDDQGVAAALDHLEQAVDVVLRAERGLDPVPASGVAVRIEVAQ